MNYKKDTWLHTLDWISMSTQKKLFIVKFLHEKKDALEKTKNYHTLLNIFFSKLFNLNTDLFFQTLTTTLSSPSANNLLLKTTATYKKIKIKKDVLKKPTSLNVKAYWTRHWSAKPNELKKNPTLSFFYTADTPKKSTFNYIQNVKEKHLRPAERYNQNPLFINNNNLQLIRQNQENIKKIKPIQYAELSSVARKHKGKSKKKHKPKTLGYFLSLAKKQQRLKPVEKKQTNTLLLRKKPTQFFNTKQNRLRIKTTLLQKISINRNETAKYLPFLPVKRLTRFVLKYLRLSVSFLKKVEKSFASKTLNARRPKKINYIQNENRKQKYKSSYWSKLSKTLTNERKVYAYKRKTKLTHSPKKQKLTTTTITSFGTKLNQIQHLQDKLVLCGTANKKNQSIKVAQSVKASWGKPYTHKATTKIPLFVKQAIRKKTKIKKAKVGKIKAIRHVINKPEIIVLPKKPEHCSFFLFVSQQERIKTKRWAAFERTKVITRFWPSKKSNTMQQTDKTQSATEVTRLDAMFQGLKASPSKFNAFTLNPNAVNPTQEKEDIREEEADNVTNALGQTKTHDVGRKFITVLWNAQRVFREGFAFKNKWNRRVFKNTFWQLYVAQRHKEKSAETPILYFLLNYNLVLSADHAREMVTYGLVAVNNTIVRDLNTFVQVGDVVSLGTSVVCLSTINNANINKSSRHLARKKQIQYLIKRSQWRNQKRQNKKAYDIFEETNEVVIPSWTQYDRFTGTIAIIYNPKEQPSTEWSKKHDFMLKKLTPWRLKI